MKSTTHSSLDLSTDSTSTKNTNASSSITPPRYLPEDKNQYIVQTPYGRGLVIRTRPHDNIKEIQLLEWNNNSGAAEEDEDKDNTSSSSSSSLHSRRRPRHDTKNNNNMLYTPASFPSVTPVLGDDVVCLYGRGKVVSTSSGQDDGRLEVQLSSWRLAGRSLVRCFLQTKDVRVVRPKRLYEMDAYERVQYAQEEKQEANRHFGHRRYARALTRYAVAVDAVRYVQHDAQSSNHVRADLVLVMITCCNNAATCCVQLSKWEECIKFATNALVLLNALYEKRGLKIHSILVKEEGLSDVKLFGEYRVKSFLVKGRAHAERREYSEALAALKQAREAIATYTSELYSRDDALKASVAHLRSQDREVKRLYAHCVQQKKMEKKKEKQRAEAMFGGKSAAALSTPTTKVSATKKPAEAGLPPVSDGGISSALSSRAVAAAAAAAATQSNGVDLHRRESDKQRTDELLEPLLPTVPTSRSNNVYELTEDDDIEEELPWYQEHKEALILSAVTGLFALTSVLLLRTKK